MRSTMKPARCRPPFAPSNLAALGHLPRLRRGRKQNGFSPPVLRGRWAEERGPQGAPRPVIVRQAPTYSPILVVRMTYNESQDQQWLAALLTRGESVDRSHDYRQLQGVRRDGRLTSETYGLTRTFTRSESHGPARCTSYLQRTTAWCLPCSRRPH